jgi:hypothetical protein
MNSHSRLEQAVGCTCLGEDTRSLTVVYYDSGRELAGWQVGVATDAPDDLQDEIANAEWFVLNDAGKALVEVESGFECRQSGGACGDQLVGGAGPLLVARVLQGFNPFGDLLRAGEQGEVRPGTGRTLEAAFGVLREVLEEPEIFVPRGNRLRRRPAQLSLPRVYQCHYARIVASRVGQKDHARARSEPAGEHALSTVAPFVLFAARLKAHEGREREAKEMARQGRLSGGEQESESGGGGAALVFVERRQRPAGSADRQDIAGEVCGAGIGEHGREPAVPAEHGLIGEDPAAEDAIGRFDAPVLTAGGAWQSGLGEQRGHFRHAMVIAAGGPRGGEGD